MNYDFVCVLVQWEKNMDCSRHKSASLFEFLYLKQLNKYRKIKLTNLLTHLNTVLFGKLTGTQLVKKFTAFYGTRKFITAFTGARHLSLAWARLTQSTPPHPTS
jgi:hypothetical protein